MTSQADTRASQSTGEAVDLLIERGVLGFVWLGADLIVRRRQGHLADWVTVGAPYDRAMPMLVGYEAKFEDLRHNPGHSAVLPNVGLHIGPSAIPKFDLQLFWLPPTSEYLAVLKHESTQSILELELHHEISRRQSREQDLLRTIKKTNAELTRANRDLEEFAYVISHDLRAPLRAMRITADQLEQELGAQLAPQSREGLTRIRMLSRRMGAMMSGLLEYARVGRKQEAIAATDTARLVRDIIQGIGSPASLPIERRGNWPILETLAEPLDVVLRNLIENAVKHHDTKQGAIVLSVHDDGAFDRFDVADDGPGIDPSYHSAIFEPFRTVAEEAPPDSSGIGLALVKKTAEMVGGRIEIVSDPACRRGTTFQLFWPKVIQTG